MLERMWGKGTHLYIAGEITNWYRHSGNQNGGSRYTLLGVYPKDSISYNRDTCFSVFTAALVIIARKQRQPRGPSMMDEQWQCGSHTQWTIIKL